MAAMTTVLTDYSSNGNSQTWSLPGHSNKQLQLVTQQRKPAGDNGSVHQDTFRVKIATVDASGNVLPALFACDINLRQPLDGAQVDKDLMLAFIRDLVASDEFAAAWNASTPIS